MGKYMVSPGFPLKPIHWIAYTVEMKFWAILGDLSELSNFYVYIEYDLGGTDTMWWYICNSDIIWYTYMITYGI